MLGRSVEAQSMGRKVKGAKREAQSVGRKVWGRKMGGAKYRAQSMEAQSG